MKKLITLILTLSLLLAVALAEEDPQTDASLVFTAEEILEAGDAALDAGEYEKAAAYYELAAEKGDDYALISIGYLYQNGFGVEQSFEKAREYYQEALDKGVEEAAELLQNLPAGK